MGIISHCIISGSQKYLLLSFLAVLCWNCRVCSGSLILVPNSLDKFENDSISISCTWSGDTSEVSKLTWLKKKSNSETEIVDGRLSTYRTGNSRISLLIPSAQKPADDAIYVCRAILTEGGEVEQGIELNLKEKVSVVNAPLSQHPTEGQDASVVCEMKGSARYPLEMVWSKDGQALSDTGGYRFEKDRQRLIIPDFQKEQHDGTYDCRGIQPDLGTFKEVQISVVGYKSPTILEEGPNGVEAKEGETASIPCVASGTPEPKIEWFKGPDSSGRKIENDGKYDVMAQQLDVIVVTEEDSGEYTCTADNGVEPAVSRTFHLTVFMKPSVEVKEEALATRDEMLEVKCLILGEDVTSKWVQVTPNGEHRTVVQFGPNEDTGNEEVFSRRVDQELVLYIASVTDGHAGQYNCVASNPGGEVSKTTIVAVQHAPEVMDSKEETVTSAVGKEMTISCKIKAVPKPMVSWNGPDETQVSPDGVKFDSYEEKKVYYLKIVLETEDDFGKYTCVAENGVGSGAKAIRNIEQAFPPAAPGQVHVVHVLPTYANVSVPNWLDKAANELPETLTIKFVPFQEYDAPGFTFDDAHTQTVSYESNKDIKISGLSPDFTYMAVLSGQNLAGKSKDSDAFEITTPPADAPETPYFQKWSVQCPEAMPCYIDWHEPENLGQPITGYKIRYRKVDLADEGQNGPYFAFVHVDAEPTRADVTSLFQLEPSTTYEFELIARNDVGDSDISAPAFVTTAKSLPIVSSGVNPGGVVTIVIFLILMVILIIDAVCYHVNKCGLIMCICVHCCDKAPPSDKVKEVGAEEGKMKSADKGIPNGDEKAHDTSEDTPMIQNQEKNTTV